MILIDYIFFGTITTASFIALLTVNTAWKKAYIFLSILLLITLINEVWCFVRLSRGQSTLAQYSVYFYLRGFLLITMFYSIFKKTPAIRNFYHSSIMVIVALVPTCIYLYTGFNKLHSFASIVIGFLILLYCLLYFFQDYKNDNFLVPYKQPLFFVTTAFTVYFLYMLPYLTMYNYLSKSYPELLIVNRYIAKTLSIFLYSFIALDFYLQWKRKRLEY